MATRTAARRLVRVSGVGRAIPIIDAECRDEGAEMSEHRVEVPLIGGREGA